MNNFTDKFLEKVVGKNKYKKSCTISFYWSAIFMIGKQNRYRKMKRQESVITKLDDQEYKTEHIIYEMMLLSERFDFSKTEAIEFLKLKEMRKQTQIKIMQVDHNDENFVGIYESIKEKGE